MRTAKKFKLGPGFSIQSKLLVMLLAVAVIAIAVTGMIGYQNGRDSLRQAAFDQLTSIQQMRAQAISDLVSGNGRAVQFESVTTDTVTASREFNEAFDELQSQPLTAVEEQQLLDYYRDTFLPALAERTGETYDAESLLPNSTAGQRLQLLYSTRSAAGDTDPPNDAGDGSTWSALNAKYQEHYESMMKKMGYDDVFLVNTAGQVVYTANKDIDLGLNLYDAPTDQTELSKAVKKVLATNSVDAMVATAVEPWIPSLEAPAGWLVSPIGRAGDISGVLVAHSSIQATSDTMTGNERWHDHGLGETGEVYLAQGNVMISNSRALIEDPERYAKEAYENGTPRSVVNLAVQTGSSVLLQPVTGDAIERAQRGETGITMGSNYLGERVLIAYGPMEIEGSQIGVIATMDESEAFAPVDEFARAVLISAAIMTILLAALSVVLARVFTRPISRLLDAVRRISTGERDVKVETAARDEFSQLGVAFNDMSSAMQTKTDLLETERAESERVLLSLMPATVADRYRQGEQTIANDHTDVTVIYADLVGFDDYAEDLDSDKALEHLNEILAGFDEIADRLGIERVRSYRHGYLASCGLNVPRVDSARRVVEFATEANNLVRRVARQQQTTLSLRAGIDSGNVTSGIVGRNSVIYDMWGDAVNLAFRLQGAGDLPGIFLSDRVAESLGGMFELEESGIVESRSGERKAWRLREEDDNV